MSTAPRYRKVSYHIRSMNRNEIMTWWGFIQCYEHKIMISINKDEKFFVDATNTLTTTFNTVYVIVSREEFFRTMANDIKRIV